MILFVLLGHAVSVRHGPLVVAHMSSSIGEKFDIGLGFGLTNRYPKRGREKVFGLIIVYFARLVGFAFIGFIKPWVGWFVVRQRAVFERGRSRSVLTWMHLVRAGRRVDSTRGFVCKGLKSSPPDSVKTLTIIYKTLFLSELLFGG